MIKFPNCKINIGLNVLGKRDDGYHDLQTVFYPVGIQDALEIIKIEDNSQQIRFTQTGLQIPGDAAGNLCVKACHLLKADYADLPGIHMHLHKQIPMGAGLGGGSADAAFTLKLLNEKFQLGLSKMQLANYASRLGSDCAFFIMGEPCFAKGRGEILEPIALDLSAYNILLVNPGIYVNTASAFGKLQLRPATIDLKQAVQEPVETWKKKIVNDFETTVFASHPEIASIKDQLYTQGAIYASMSGSGSSVYGIFSKEMQPKLIYPSHYFFRWI